MIKTLDQIIKSRGMKKAQLREIGTALTYALILCQPKRSKDSDPVSNAERQLLSNARKSLRNAEYIDIKELPKTFAGMYKKIKIETTTNLITVDLSAQEYLFFTRLCVKFAT